MSRETPDLLILSGAYCSAEITAEFGALPPAFLPVANKLLLELQVAALRDDVGQIYITLPSSFHVKPADKRLMSTLNVSVIRTASELPLAKAAEFALKHLSKPSSLMILFGDTLVSHDSALAPDHFAVSNTSEYFQWADVSRPNNKSVRLDMGYKSGERVRTVACGLFSFSSAPEFLHCLETTGDFLAAVEAYSVERELFEEPVAEWYDFGHLPLLYRSRREMLVSRDFNTVISDGNKVTKFSTDRSKIRAEVEWYLNIPPHLRSFLPQFIEFSDHAKRPSYSCEYLYLPTLAELSVFGRLPRYVWRTILNSCLEFLSLCRTVPESELTPLNEVNFASSYYAEIIVNKSISRFSTFIKSRGWSRSTIIEVNGVDSPPLWDILDTCLSMISPTSTLDLAYSHGDFFFGNSFFDFRAGKIKVIDPRGSVFPGKPTVYGDYRYDLAKLSHSVIGGYDVLLANRAGFETLGEQRFRLSEDFLSTQDDLLNLYKDLTFLGNPVLSREIIAMTCLLFLSMLPLHAEQKSRQDAFLANAVRLYNLIEGTPV